MNISRMSPENLRKIAHTELEISNVSLIRMWNRGNDHTDRHTKNLKLSETIVQTSLECQENLRKIAHTELEISLIH